MPTPENHLLAALPRAALARFVANSEVVRMPLDCVLWKPDEDSGVAYFPLNGVVSLEAVVKDIPSLQVGMIGREGMAGMHLLLGARSSSLYACVFMGGNARACQARDLQHLMQDCQQFRRVMGRYIEFTLAQLCAAAACVRFHHIEQRLAKWLLMSHDRADGETIYATHETMALMLGVRRVGITVAATAMQNSGYIRYNRGEIKIMDRAGLECKACSCYARETSLMREDSSTIKSRP
jgi:CRP-like cAMP-binding protein